MKDDIKRLVAGKPVAKTIRAHVFRLYPTPQQEARLSSWVGAVRAVYNLALEQRRTFWRPGRRFDCVTQARELTALRAAVDWIQDAPRSSLDQALRDLDQAYANWWSMRAGAPGYRKRGLNDSFRLKAADVGLGRTSKQTGFIRLPKMGRVRVRWDAPLVGQFRNVTISRKGGAWFATCQCLREDIEAAPSLLPAVGIDRGVAVFAALSTGELIAPANAGKKSLRALARAQRMVARKVKGSNNRRKAALKVSRLQTRVKNARADYLHKLSTAIAQKHGMVVIEKLNVQGMTASASGTVESPGRNVRQKAGLNRSILDQGWGRFGSMLAYKLADRGGVLVEVPAAYTSQTCSVCGVIDADSRRAQRFLCRSCGFDAHADINASVNILRRGTASMPVEGCHLAAPDEAGTCVGGVQ